ncbi:zf-HC2 domain-containing protein [Lolliginicoccus suaedae]|uniref:zf-HC2 domain-containing protein n=1 Tax=Lolliginicoccus suaedae TaxID=2605429 RepID=UPI0011EFB735|nr:zf-HC2 domain-containing protein [Lolliginicoccus suaedae]
MIRTLATMLACHWSAHRIQRYLDRDPAAPLTADETHRLESHLAQCERCQGLADEYRFLHGAVGTWARRSLPPEPALQRMHELVDRLSRGENQ